MATTTAGDPPTRRSRRSRSGTIPPPRRSRRSRSGTSPPPRRSRRKRSGTSTTHPHDNKHPPKSADLRSSNSDFRRQYQLIETINARLDVVEWFDREYAHVRSGSSDGTTDISVVDDNRLIFRMIEFVLARLCVVEGMRDICYQKAFKAAGETGCIVRGCGAKASSGKNDGRHFKSTENAQHMLAFYLSQQKECLQCGLKFKRKTDLEAYEQEVHHETRSSRIDIFRPFLEQPLASISRCQPSQSTLSAPDNVEPDIADPNQLNWSKSNDLQPLTDPTPTDCPLHPPQPGAESLPMPAWDDLQPNWSSSNDFQPWEQGSSAYHSMQPLHSRFMPATNTPNQPEQAQAEYIRQSMAPSIDYPPQSSSVEFVFPQPNWSGFNDLHHSGHY